MKESSGVRETHDLVEGRIHVSRFIPLGYIVTATRRAPLSAA